MVSTNTLYLNIDGLHPYTIQYSQLAARCFLASTAFKELFTIESVKSMDSIQRKGKRFTGIVTENSNKKTVY